MRRTTELALGPPQRGARTRGVHGTSGCTVTVRMRHSGAVITRPPASSIPDAPGSYQFIDAGGRVLYVGKAKSLRSRLSNYFADPATLARQNGADGALQPTTSSGSRSPTTSRR